MIFETLIHLSEYNSSGLVWTPALEAWVDAARLCQEGTASCHVTYVDWRVLAEGWTCRASNCTCRECQVFFTVQY